MFSMIYTIARQSSARLMTVISFMFNSKGLIMLKILWIVLNIVLFGLLSIGFGYLLAEALT
jgi:hypothetical protein